MNTSICIDCCETVSINERRVCSVVLKICKNMYKCPNDYTEDQQRDLNMKSKKIKVDEILELKIK